MLAFFVAPSELQTVCYRRSVQVEALGSGIQRFLFLRASIRHEGASRASLTVVSHPQLKQ